MNVPESRTNVLKLGTLWAVLFAVLMLWSFEGKAEVLAVNTSKLGITILLMDDACKLEAVSNLKGRAVWQEKGKTFEGCWGVGLDSRNQPIVLAYFSDKTVASIPVQDFKQAVGA